MIGAIIGDVIGSVFENENTKSEDFPLFSRFSRFTDDTVLTVAIADAVLHLREHSIALLEDHNNKQIYALHLKSYARRFPHAGYGQMFHEWAASDSLHGYRSLGNGSAMRVSPIGFAFESLGDVLKHAKLSACVTHNHPEGIRGAQAVASAIFLARQGRQKTDIRTYIERHFHYDLSQRLSQIRPSYKFDSTCQGSVPPALIAFLESDDFEDAIRKAISLGGDSDTIACITGGIAQAYYGSISPALVAQTNLLLDANFKHVIKAFNSKFNVKF